LSFYLDTSAVVAAITNEPATPAIRAWLGQNDSADFLISEWVRTEVSSALSIKLRTGQLGEPHRAQALAQFNQFCRDSFITLQVTADHFRIAARIADQHALGLRAGDALHLAIAKERGATICTFDRRIVDAGPALAIPTVTP
jgi:predicted nucleic acid-binding protein